MAGKACGVGMNITSDLPFTVQLMHEGRSAHRSGIIKCGDVIAMIDGVPLAGETVARLTQLMLGPPGTFVQLTLYRGAQTIVVSLIRSPSKLTPLQVNQQRESQNGLKATFFTPWRRSATGADNRGSGVEREKSRMTENSFLCNQNSYASIDENECRELGGEDSWDALALAPQASVVGSEASFDPERGALFNQLSEKSFDPEALEYSGNLMSERSFDPELLVQMSEKSFDPEVVGVDGRSICSEKSFDPEMIGFMSEKSFDPECQDTLRQLSLHSQQSFDPELLDLDDVRSERSFDPEHAATTRSMSLSSQKSFDPELLHFEESRMSLSHAREEEEEEGEEEEEVSSQTSFDPETGGGGGRGASVSSEQSFDPEGAASSKSKSTSSELSFDPEERSSGGGTGALSVSVSSEKSFDPEGRGRGGGDGQGKGERSTASVSSEHSFDPEGAGAKGKGSVASEESFDPEAQGGARGRGGGRGGGKSVSSEQSFDAEAVSPGKSLTSQMSYDPERSVAGAGGSFASHASFDASAYAAVTYLDGACRRHDTDAVPAYQEQLEESSDEMGGGEDEEEEEGEEARVKGDKIRAEMSRLVVDASLAQELRRALESEEWTSAAAAAEASPAPSSPTASSAISLPPNKVVQARATRQATRQAPAGRAAAGLAQGGGGGGGGSEEVVEVEACASSTQEKRKNEPAEPAAAGGAWVHLMAGGSGGECDAEAVADKLCDKQLRARLLAELEAARSALESPSHDTMDKLERLRRLLKESVRAAAPRGGKGSGRMDQGGCGFTTRRLQTGLFQVRELKQGGPAERCGKVLVGDTLVAVDAHSTKGLASTQLADLLLGPKGSCCALRLQRAGQEVEVTLERQAKVRPCGGSRHSQQNGSPSCGPTSSTSSTRTRNASSASMHAGVGFTFKKASSSSAYKDGWRVSTLKPDGYALYSGLIQEGDVIVSIDGVTCKGLSAAELTALIRGPVDSEARIEVVREASLASHGLMSFVLKRWFEKV